MIFTKTTLKDVFTWQPQIHTDERGCFFESFSAKNFQFSTLQLNQSVSCKNVIRGMHIQLAPHGQAKIIHVISGAILDAVTDLRQDSETFGKSYTTELSAANNTHIFIPRGFAHGFKALEDNTTVIYQADSLYEPNAQYTIKFDDEDLHIDWQLGNTKPLLSQKDAQALSLKEYLGVSSVL